MPLSCLVPFPSLFMRQKSAGQPVRRRAGDCEGGEVGKDTKSPSFFFSSVQGTRPYNEDVVCGQLELLDGRSAFFGCFDGHAGKRAAHWAQESLGQALCNNLQRLKPVQALKTSFLATNDGFLRRASLEDLNDGCTATTALLLGTDLYVANAGDSRTILCRSPPGACIPLSVDHKPSVPAEAARIKERGGKVMTPPGSSCARVNGQLATSRGFGDRGFAKYITAEPDVRCHKVEAGDDFLVLATDGLWDVLSNEQAAAIVRSCETATGAARALTAEALRLGSLDNITALVVDLRPLHAADTLDDSDTLSAAGTTLQLSQSSTSPRRLGAGGPVSSHSGGQDKYCALDAKIEAMRCRVESLEENQQFFEDSEKIRQLRKRLEALEARRRL